MLAHRVLYIKMSNRLFSLHCLHVFGAHYVHLKNSTKKMKRHLIEHFTYNEFHDLYFVIHFGNKKRNCKAKYVFFFAFRLNFKNFFFYISFIISIS